MFNTKKLIIIATVVLIAISIVFLYGYGYSKYGKQKINLQCEEGYTPVGVPGNFAPNSIPEYYCKINKEWDDFEPCNMQSDCPENLLCTSPGSRIEMRCIPAKNYRMDCYCYPEDRPDGGGCVCS